jgi:YVTN family beta-propeller protein
MVRATAGTVGGILESAPQHPRARSIGRRRSCEPGFAVTSIRTGALSPYWGPRSAPTLCLALTIALVVTLSPFAMVASASDSAPAISMAAPISIPGTAGFTLSNSAAVVGETLNATGTGFPPTSFIGFTVGGWTVASSCRTDATGAFPGSSGTPCSFVVPAVVGGNESVSAGVPGATLTSPSAVNPGIPLGGQPTSEAYANSSDKLYVSVVTPETSSPNEVVELSPSTGSIVNSIAVENSEVGHPEGLVYDWGTNQLFVASAAVGAAANFVDVIACATNQIVARIALPANTTAGLANDTGIAYDNTTGQIFVSNTFDNNVTVLSDANDSIVATVPVLAPAGMAYDWRAGAMVVADDATNGTATVIEGSNDSVRQVLPLGLGPTSPQSDPLAVAYDNATNRVDVADGGSANVSFLSASGGIFSVAAIASSGDDPDGVAIDPIGDFILTSNGAPGTFTEIAGAVDHAVATRGSGLDPVAVAVDPSSGVAFVANAGSANLTEFAYDPTALATTNLTVGSSVSLLPSRGAPGTTFEVEGSGFAPGAILNVSIAGATLASNCTSAPDGSFPGGDAGPCDLEVPALAGGGYPVTVANGSESENSTFDVLTSLTISRTSGPTGSWVNATGLGFPASARINLSAGGASVAWSCRSDASGSFPGSSGSNCTFAVPYNGLGPDPIIASNGSLSANTTFYQTYLSQVPHRGPDGTWVNASGQGLPPDVRLGFLLDGRGIAAGCLTNGSGDFPGTGASCSFEIPSTPGGAQNITAVGGTFDFGAATSTTSLGATPSAAAFDPQTDQVFVTIPVNGTVLIVNQSTGQIVSTVTIPSNGGLHGSPVALAYDAASGEMFVASIDSHSVSIYSDASGSIVSTVSVGLSPDGVVYDAGQGEVFVSDAATNAVSVVNAGTHAVVATVAVGNAPAQGAYDPSSGLVFIPDAGSGAVSVISDSTNLVVATVPVGSVPVAAAWDPDTGNVYVANSGDDTVSVLSGTTGALLANLLVGDGPSSLAIDAETGAVFVENAFDGTASVISDTNNSIVTTIPVGPDPLGAALDYATEQLYTANGGPDGTLTAIPVPQVDFGTESFSVMSEIETNLSADYGQRLWVEGSGFGSDLSFGTFTLGTQGVTCDAASNGDCVGGTLQANVSGAFDAEFTVPDFSTSGTYNLTLTDSAGNSATTPVVIDPDPSIGSIQVSRPSADLGQNFTVGITVSAGSGGFVYEWYNLPTGCGIGNTSVVNCTASAPGNFSILAQATDSNGFQVTSLPLSFEIYPDPSASVPRASFNAHSVDAGTAVNFTSEVTGGTGEFVAYNWTGLPAGCVTNATRASCAPGVLGAGSYNISLQVTDSNGVSSPPTAGFTFTVDPDPEVSSPQANRTSGDVGQSILFSVTAVNGSGVYAYRWNGLPTGCGSYSAEYLACVPSGPGPFTVSVTVTDSNGFAVSSSSLALTIFSDPSVNLTANRSAFDVGDSVSLLAVASGGAGAYVYNWSGLPTGCPAAGASIECTPSEHGTYPVRALVVDANGYVVESTPVTLNIADPVTATISASSLIALVGQNLTFSATASGGTGALSFAWMFGDGTSSNGRSVLHVYTKPGEYTVVLWTNDTVGSSSMQSLLVNVSAAPLPTTPGGSSGPSSLEDLVIGIVAAAAAIALLVATLRWRRKPPEPVASAENKPRWVLEDPFKEE